MYLCLLFLLIHIKCKSSYEGLSMGILMKTTKDIINVKNINTCTIRITRKTIIGDKMSMSKFVIYFAQKYFIRKINNKINNEDLLYEMKS